MDRFRGDPQLGRLLRPGNGNRPDEFPWAVDNGAFAGFDEAAFLTLLRQVGGKPGCLWVVAPDVVGDSRRTIDLFSVWEPRIREAGFPVAFVAQDGQTEAETPWQLLDCLFVGGTTEFKLGPEAASLMVSAKRRNKLVHVGRVNSIRRMRYVYELGADSVDGTQFSMFPDRWIPWALERMRVVTPLKEVRL